MNKYIKNLLKLNLEKIVPFVLLGIIVIAALVWIIQGFSQKNIDTTFYQVKSDKINKNIRVVFIADLHLKEFGEKNIRLVNEIKELNPDIIAVAGDMTTIGKKYDVVITLMKQLVKVAPVYYSYGNHEFSDVLFNKSQIGKDLQKTGVTVLSNKYEKVKINNNEISIGGICASEKTFSHVNIKEFFKKYDTETNYKLLLCHHPEVFLNKMEEHPVDLALCGHAHGGQIILPIIGGLYSPEQGLFPKLVQGYHIACGSEVIITRGLGNSSYIPRFNNNPEIVVIDINKY